MATIDRITEALAMTERAAAHLRRLLDELQQEPDPAPTPAPAPVPAPPAPVPAPAPDPTPPPPPAGALPVVTVEPVTRSSVILFDSQHYSSRYERFQRTQIIVGNGRLRFRRHDIAGGGSWLALAPGRYALMIDGEEHAAIEVTGGTVGEFSVAESSMRPGWRRVQVMDPSGGLSPSWFVHVGAARADDSVPVCSGSFEIAKGKPYAWAWVHADATPARWPIVPRECPHFSAPISAAQLVQSVLVPDTGTRRISSRGSVRTTFGRQAYFFSDLIQRLPPIPLLDGPRGIGTLAMPTHIEIGRATLTAEPASRPIGAIYVADPWRFMRIDADGKIRTLVGWRHRSPPSQWEGTPDLELVGDWSAVPAERRGIHEAWGWCWDRRTLATDTTAPADADGRQPHGGNPTGYLTDSQNGRVLRVEFDGRSHDTPAKVSEFLTGLSDPWDVVEHGDEIIVSERTAHRICAYDMDTGALRRVILQGEPLASVNGVRWVIRLGTLDALRAAPCVAPEGLYRLGDWLYFGSFAQAQARRINLSTGELQVVGAIPTDNNSRFAKIAVSDGTFGPAGTVFAATWSIAQFGYPSATLPDGSAWTIARNTGAALPIGRGPYWRSLSYAAAVAVGAGRLICGSATYGLHVISQALPTDTPLDAAAYRAGEAAIDHLLFGEGGHDPYSLGLPWGQSPEVDYYLAANGHARYMAA